MIVYYDGHPQQENAMSIHQRMTLDDLVFRLFYLNNYLMVCHLNLVQTLHLTSPPTSGQTNMTNMVKMLPLKHQHVSTVA